jgi:hypothetical protein
MRHEELHKQLKNSILGYLNMQILVDDILKLFFKEKKASIYSRFIDRQVVTFILKSN